jgi:arylsulfatase A-like enzyme
VLDLLGVDARALPAEGRSLTPLLDSRPGWTAREVFLQRRTFPPGANDNWFAPPWLPRPTGHPIVGGMFAVRSSAWKYIEAPQAGTRELYDLAADPGERHNLASSHPDIVRALHLAIVRWLAAVQRPGSPSPLNEEDRARLRSLGYVG